MKNSKKTTTAKDWLEMDLKAQSGAIWTEENVENKPVEKKKSYINPEFHPTILKPDPIFYSGKEIQIIIPQVI